MLQKKKLQVFISSTYSDLLEERQAAVEAVLTAGHIPAGMELFTAGDESQMKVIKRWIDDSDVYMLILGGRYGSIESKTKKSYTHLEYEYALKKGKSLFAVVIDEKYLEKKLKKSGINVENDNPDKLKEFRVLVLTKLVKFWRDTKDIKLAVLETLSEFSKRNELIGWVKGDESISSASINGDANYLIKENSKLRSQIKNLSISLPQYNGLTFEEMYKFLNSRKIHPAGSLDFDTIEDSKEVISKISKIAAALGDKEPSLLHFFWIMSGKYNKKLIRCDYGYYHNEELYNIGILEQLTIQQRNYRNEIETVKVYILSTSGKQFLLRLRQVPKFVKTNAEKYIL